MNEKSKRKAQIISFLSGKGGAGKTSIAIGMSYLLNDAGFKVLLVDFDMSTHGGSYFFRYICKSHGIERGIYELLRNELTEARKRYSQVEVYNFEIEYTKSCLEIKKGLLFIPSRVDFARKAAVKEENYYKFDPFPTFLKHLLNYYSSKVDFIIIDNQAGTNSTSRSAAKLSNKAIIVSELDPISSDAVDSLLIEMGDVLPDYRRYLINKLDFREQENYELATKLFQTMNRLPPIPFDFDVRSAFASRSVPIDVEKPSAFLLSLYSCVEAFFPEYQNKLEPYRDKIKNKYNEYQARLDSLINRQAEIDNRLSNNTSIFETPPMLLKIIMYGIISSTIVITFTLTYTSQIKKILDALNINMYSASPIAIITITFVIGILGSLITNFVVDKIYLSGRQRLGRSMEKDQLLKLRDSLNKEIDQYESLLLTKKRTFLSQFDR